MLDKSSIALIGYSGHAFVVLEAADLMGLNISGYLEQHSVDFNSYNLEYLGFEGDKDFDWSIAEKFVLGLGENNLRFKIGELVKSKNKDLLNIFHPTAALSASLKIGSGNFIAANATVNALASIGDYCILNTGCIVEHECTIEDAAHIASGAVLTGNVKVGARSFIGANSVVRQGVNIGKNVIVGAGSTVIKDIPDNQVWVGNPAKLLKK